ncbi:MAG: DNA-binding transcriptional regulator Fis [Gammaproteobacteria bacterium]|nr:DNA-binding transcriptional regulator Fis [Gammaproteobacteria bacterium]
MNDRGTAARLKDKGSVVDFAVAKEAHNKPLRECAESALRRYFNDLDGETPANLYEMVIREVEEPLLQATLEFTRGNQSKAAEILGINRSTLRKKLRTHGLHN